MLKKENKISGTLSRGYTIDELRYHIVYTSLQREFCKDKLMTTVREATQSLPFNGAGASTGRGAGLTLLTSLMRGLSFADYILVAFSAFKTIKAVTGLFRRKRRSK